MAPADGKSSPGWKSCFFLEISKSGGDEASGELDGEESRAGDKHQHSTWGV